MDTGIHNLQVKTDTLPFLELSANGRTVHPHSSLDPRFFRFTQMLLRVHLCICNHSLTCSFIKSYLWFDRERCMDIMPSHHSLKLVGKPTTNTLIHHDGQCLPILPSNIQKCMTKTQRVGRYRNLPAKPKLWN